MLLESASNFHQDDDLHALVEAREINLARIGVACVLIGQAQFLIGPKVEQLAQVSDDLDIPVLCYGLRTDFQGNLFSGSAALLGWADNLTELKTICQYFPKQTDFDEISDHEIAEVESKLNQRPRKCLDSKTPHEIFFR